MILQVKNMVKCGVFTAILCLCGFLAVPVGSSVVTLQSFGVFLALGLLGGRWGTVSVFMYLLCGAAGLPVFSGFRGGIGVLLGATGGYLWGFLAAGLCYWVLSPVLKKKWICMALGQMVCYVCGTVWYLIGYGADMGLVPVLSVCVLPYLLPDAVKIWLATALTYRLQNRI